MKIWTKQNLLAKPITTDYDRDLVFGDIMLCSGSRLVPELIEEVTGSPWCHAAILAPTGDETIGTLVIESLEGHGVRVVPLKFYLENYYGNGQPYDGQIVVVRNEGLTMNSGKHGNLVSFALSRVGAPYNYSEIVEIFSKTELGFGYKSGKGYICSEFVAAALLAVGVRIDTVDDFVRPSDIWADKNTQFLYRIL